ncbi:hypothetical protein CKO38_04050 [Rhodospirillum rubrum]|uniref:hypothetical protein n=1 Tax=Rhodospirillum rubrum TaxID=1085 RepID=UPI0019073030|nr:hypothetical protein [Rhodospirillum rubrum]MBK1663803.1 hypothetical protein [Rhodospirillum rubrum]MBK1675858.1 hypothetical protein [Rhodospirillum rubrum]
MRKLWHRSKFHLSALMLLLPAFYFAQQHGAFSTTAVGAMPATAPAAVALGPWRVAVSAMPGLPEPGADGALRRFILVKIVEGDVDTIRGSFLRIGKPRNIRTLGALAYGNPHFAMAQVPVPEGLTGKEELWLTIEGWDGTLHQTSWPLAAVTGQGADQETKEGNR